MQEPEVFAINPRDLGHNPRKYHRGYAQGATAAQITALLGSPELKAQVEQVRAGQEAKKEGLFAICPHYSGFRDNHRAQEAIVPERFTFVTCVDVDDLSIVDRAIQSALAVNQDELSDWQGQVLYVEYSPRKKCHIWIRVPKGRTVEEAQRAFCDDTEIPFDESCLTPERYIFMTGDAVYQSEEWLKPLSEAEVEERREAYLMRGLDADGRPLSEAAPLPCRGGARGGVCNSIGGEGTQGDTDPTPNPSPTREGSGCATERTLYIFDTCMREAGLEPVSLVKKGGRHDALKAILSVGANQLLTQDELTGVLQVRMAQNWQDKNIRRLVSDFYQKYTDSSQKMNAFQRRVFAQSLKKSDEPVEAADNGCGSEGIGGDSGNGIGGIPIDAALSLSQIYAAKRPPRLPRQLPGLVKAVLAGTPDSFRETVAQAMFPPLATYPRELSFVYIDNCTRELRINCLIIAPSGSGKDSCTRQPLNHILADMKERDQLNRDRLDEYNEQVNSRANNKEAPKRPANLVIQTLKSDITRAALVQRSIDAQGYPLYVRLNELEQWDKVECATGRNNHFTVMKQTDDEDNDFGADRASWQSVNGGGRLHLNFNANTVPGKAVSYFRQVMVDGPISRLCLATVPDGEMGEDIPVYGRYDEAYDAALKPYIDHLKEATGETDCQQARRMARRLLAECADFARLSQDGVFNNLYRRGLVHAFRKACLLYAANGMRWERQIEQFCRWSLHYDLWLKLRFFGDYIRQAEDDLQPPKPGPTSLLEMLPEEFTTDDAVKVRLKRGMSAEGTEGMLRQWVHRKHVLRVTDDRYKKVHSS